MCDTCGCNITPGNAHLAGAGNGAPTSIEVLSNLLGENDRQAGHNREHLSEAGILAVNLMSSPGAGKTRLLEATIDALRAEFRIAVIEGDLETENDAERIRAHGVPAIQITTGGACHLDAHLVHHALHELERQLDLDHLDLLFIENVGNLVCPASFDLGQHLNVALLSVPEGDDKPAKYPVMFRACDLVLLSKADLLPVLDDFSPTRAEACLRALATQAPFLSVSARGEPGPAAWLTWLRERLSAHRAAHPSAPGERARHHHHDHHHDHHHGHHHHGHPPAVGAVSSR